MVTYAVLLLLAFEAVVGVSYYEQLSFQNNCQQQVCEMPYYTTSAHYEYDPSRCEGQEEWSELAECWELCDREESFIQSPINIRVQDTVYNQFLTFQFQNSLCNRVPGTAMNKGEAPVFNALGAASKAIKITNVPRTFPTDTYTFGQMAFHIGHDRNKGSEHTVDVKYYPIEVQMTFWNDKYRNAQSAKDKKDGLVVISVFVSIAPNHTDFSMQKVRRPYLSCTCRNSDFFCIRSRRCKCRKDTDCGEGAVCQNSILLRKPMGYCRKQEGCPVRAAKKLNQLMTTYFPQIQTYQSPSVPVPITGGLSPHDVLPSSWDFYTYKGSLTTPPCFETVRWIIMRCPVSVSEQAYRHLSQIQDRRLRPLNTHGVQRQIQRGLPAQLPVRDLERNFMENQPYSLIPDCPAPK